ncbi:hypothetical protein [Azohydromonas australica]|uniref:hypothetical protein n=1 Tax=Azohydromonas australica TaxID=364039 RepID=UPI0012EC78BA|nr:hypothetical protein [Azohydromonas australica]
MKTPVNIKRGFQVFAGSIFLLAIFVGKIGPGAYVIGFMLGRFFGLRSGLEGMPCMLVAALLAALMIWIPFVLGTSGLGIILAPFFAAYAIFVWIGICSGDRARRKRQAKLAGE